MNKVFLIAKDIHGEEVRISAGDILSYANAGTFTSMTVGQDVYHLDMTCEQIDQILVECCFMVKRCSV